MIKECNLAVLAKTQANQRDAESYLWHTQIQELLTALERKDEEEHHSKYATYGGPGQRKRFDAFPPALEHLPSARATQVGNRKPFLWKPTSKRMVQSAASSVQRPERAEARSLERRDQT